MLNHKSSRLSKSGPNELSFFETCFAKDIVLRCLKLWKFYTTNWIRFSSTVSLTIKSKYIPIKKLWKFPKHSTSFFSLTAEKQLAPSMECTWNDITLFLKWLVHVWNGGIVRSPRITFLLHRGWAPVLQNPELFGKTPHPTRSHPNMTPTHCRTKRFLILFPHWPTHKQTQLTSRPQHHRLQ